MTPKEQAEKAISDLRAQADAAQAEADQLIARYREVLGQYKIHFGDTWSDGRRIIAGKGGVCSLRSVRNG